MLNERNVCLIIFDALAFRKQKYVLLFVKDMNNGTYYTH